MIFFQHNRFLLYENHPVSSHIWQIDPRSEGSDDWVSCCIQHNHAAVEIITLREGTVSAQLGDEVIPLHPGDTLFMNPFDIHTLRTARGGDPVTYQCINFNLSFLMRSDLPEVNSRLSDLEQGRIRYRSLIPAGTPLGTEADELMHELHARYEARQTVAGLLGVHAGLERFLSMLERAGFAYLPENSGQSGRETFSKEIVQYVCTHYAEPVTTEDAAAAVHLNKSYFCRIFRRIFGQTFADYLNRYRISVAKTLSLQEHRTLQAIAEAVGYRDYDSFTRHFRRQTGRTPGAYFSRTGG